MSFKTKQILEPTLNSAHNQTEKILNLINEGICQINIDGQITYANHSVHTMLNKSEKEIIGKHYAEVFFAIDKDKYFVEKGFCPIDFALSEGQISHVNTDSFYKSDGVTEFAVEYICVPIVEESKTVGAVISFDDITERREIEVQISKARDAALEAATAKAAFLANMSHEIRTPLSGIVGTVSLLLDSALNDEQQKYTEMLKKSTKLLSQTVNDILDYSKIEAGKFEREHLEFDIYKNISDTIELFKPLTINRDLNLKIDFDELISKKVVGDIQSIQQVLNNFISNAIKFTKTGDITLKVEKITNNLEKTKIRFSVTDQGIGIDKLSQEELFHPFTQADSSITRKFGGTGLGLAICRQLVNLMDGEIGVESQLGRGSTFWFECEFAIGKMKREEIMKNVIYRKFESESNERRLIETKKDLRVLIADDNPTNREITKVMFKHLGYKSKTVTNGLEAVKACIDEDFDLVLMDCHMPEMDGFKASSLIRKKDNVKNTPKIIAFTASITMIERDRCFSVGMDDYLNKPFTKEDLSDVLERHFHIQSLPSNLDLEENMIQHSLAKLIDPKMLQSFIDIEANDEKGFVFELLDIFLNHADEKIAETEDAITNQNREIIRANAHSLKGSGGNVGLTDISKLFEDLETKSKEADWNEIESVFVKTRNIFTETKQKILEKKP